MSEVIRTILDSVATEVRDADHRLASLHALLERITEGDCFSEAEVAATEREIEVCEALALEKRQVLDEKIRVYEDEFVVLERKLAARKAIIEANTSDSTAHRSPQLFELFVREHAALTAELEQARALLLDGCPPEAD